VTPFAASTAELYTGAIWSTVELFVTLDAAKVTASLPAVSWVAVFVVAELTAGAVYATVTALPLPIADAKVSCTVIPEIATELTVTALAFAVTAKALANGAVVPNDSL
jgi:hypothetical protein